MYIMTHNNDVVLFPEKWHGPKLTTQNVYFTYSDIKIDVKCWFKWSSNLSCSTKCHNDTLFNSTYTIYDI